MAARAMAHGWARRLPKARLWLRVFRIALRCYGSPAGAFRGLRALAARRARARGERRPTYKYARAGGRWFWDLYSPGFPSPAFDRYIEEELNQSLPFRPDRASLQVLLMAITKACPLACEHCFEWDALNKPESLSAADLEAILEKFLAQGAAQVQFTGGEPLRRFGDLLSLVRRAGNRADTWIITSGAGLTAGKAARLKEAGLTGVLLSLDDWDPARHDRFRGSPHAFAGARAAAQAARDHDLLLALSLCATKAFATPENLRAYADLAREWGAGFIQIVEPKAVGHYANLPVTLGPGHIALLERFYGDLSFSPDFKDHPSAAYQGYAQRREGCGGAARRYLYVDTDGKAEACPFCRRPPGEAKACLENPVHLLKQDLKEAGCPRFDSVENREIPQISSKS